MKLNANGLGLTLAIWSAVYMLVISLLGLGGIYLNGVEAMQAWHIWYDLTTVGIILGIIEAFVIAYVGGYLVAWLYNKLA